jgi:hypothetical protein
MMAAGVAMPNAQGHEIAKTETMVVSAMPWLLKASCQTTNVKSEMETTTGTKTFTTLSAIR